MMLTISQSSRAVVQRLGIAVMFVGSWLAIPVCDLVLSVMFFSEPSPELLLYGSPLLLPVPFIVSLAVARGTVEVTADALVIRHRRVLRRPLVISRAQVRRVLLDDGRHTGRARFATGDPADPLLWTDPVPGRQPDGKVLLGDGILPNVAIVVDPPLPMDAARDAWTSLGVCGDVAQPRRGTNAHAVMLAMQDLEAVRRALTGWPVEQPELALVVPPEVAEAARRVPIDAGALVGLSMFGALCLALGPWPLAVGAFAIGGVYVHAMIKRRLAAAEQARRTVQQHAMSPEDRATALAAIDANLSPRSQGPPGWS